MITASSIICSGIAFGGGLLVQIFARAGVGGSLCGPGEDVCDKQFIFLSEVFNAALGVSLISQFVGGLIYDRHGGRVVGGISSSLVALGFLVIQVPLLGAQKGHDERSSGWLVWALVIADSGAMLSNITPMTMAWHLHEMQTLVAASSACTTSVTALLPMLMSALMHWTGASLSLAMWVWLALVALAGICMHYAVPTLPEYRAEAEKVLGTALPPADRLGKVMTDSFAVFRPDWPFHLLFVVVIGAYLTASSVYTNLLGDLGLMLFDSSAAGEELGAIYNALYGTGGAGLALLLACAGDRLEHGTPLLLAGMSAPAFVASLTIAQPTWAAQVATCAALASSGIFGITLVTKYLLAYAGPTLFGTVNGLFGVFVSLVFLPMQASVFLWMSLLPASSAVHLRLPLGSACIFFAVCSGAWSSCLLYRGLPEKPVILTDGSETQPLLPPGSSSP